MQPGCEFLKILCSHSRAYMYFYESLNPNYRFESCGDSHKKEIHKQNPSPGLDSTETCEILGIHSNKTEGRFFVETNASPPFAKKVSL